MSIQIVDHHGDPQDFEWLKRTYGHMVFHDAGPGPKFKLTDVRVTDGPASIEVLVLDEAGEPETNVTVVNRWPDDSLDDLRNAGWKTLIFDRGDLKKTDTRGLAGFGIGTGSYVKDLKKGGPHTVWVLDQNLPSDGLQGIGMLGGTEHQGPLSLTFQRVVSDDDTGTEEPDPGGEVTEPEKPTGPGPTGEATRPPTVTITEQDKERLKKFPRPPQDNGRGLHFHLDLDDNLIRKTIKQLKSIDCTWTRIYAQDEKQAKRAAKACWDEGIMPVVRMGKKVDEAYDPLLYVEALKSIGVPLYIQIFNEPDNRREWKNGKPSNWRDIFARNWANQAAQVFDAGAMPGLQILGHAEFDKVVDAVKAIGREDIWERAFFALHNYGVNHPPDYPYDDLNPGITILDDHNSVLSFLAYASWMKERIGFVLPMVGGEGGWLYGNHDDRRYPKAEKEVHARYTKEMFEQFRTGVLSNGEPLPDYLFSITPWIANSWDYIAQNWWDNKIMKDGKITETIEAVQSIPPFVRHFSWDVEEPDGGEPTEPEEPAEQGLEERLLAKAADKQVLQLNPDAALQKRIFADGFVPTSPEFTLTQGEQRYVAQLAERLSDGVVRVYYVPEGDWGNVAFVQR